ncbi:hypothetical protein Pelo_13509 [Pelomyxa schiedti]|nr:hypothetical protein Pelo_13509 [Pelomyxa schiedti]
MPSLLPLGGLVALLFIFPDCGSSSSPSPSSSPSSNGELCTKNYTCVDVNDKCDYEGLCTDPNNDCCPMNYYCIDSECSTDSEGLECNVDASQETICYANMLGSQMIECMNNTCLPLGNAHDDCDEEHGCWGSMLCVDGECLPHQYQEPCEAPYTTDDLFVWRSVGMTCDTGLYCSNSGQCEYTLSEGATCSPGGTPCGTNLFCDITSSQCIQLFSVEEGSACYEGDYICDPSCQCIGGICTLISEPELTQCDSDSDCSGTECQCSYYTGTSYCEVDMSTVCLEEEKSMYICFSDKACVGSYFSLDSYSCQKSKCGSQVTDFYSCTLCGYVEEPHSPCVTRDDKDKYCPNLETWEILVILSVLVTVIILVVIVIIVCFACQALQSKNNYNKVKT